MYPLGILDFFLLFIVFYLIQKYFVHDAVLYTVLLIFVTDLKPTLLLDIDILETYHCSTVTGNRTTFYAKDEQFGNGDDYYLISFEYSTVSKCHFDLKKK